MWMVFTGLGVILLGALLAAIFSGKGNVAPLLAVSTVWIGSAVITVPAASVLGGGPSLFEAYAWYLPFGAFEIGLDGLSAYFLFPILILAPLTALYGRGYLAGRSGVGAHYFFFNALVLSMILLVVAKDGILFLLAWEAMAVSSFFLVVYEHERGEVREAGWTYLVATHIGTAFLFVFFVVLGGRANTFSFSTLATMGAFEPTVASILFVLAVIGFGAKAGLFPFHVWLPEAHPAAPSHVSALMSGVMIKMGVYGLLRSLTFLGAPSPSWGWALVALGVVSGVQGVVSALAQHDIKRLLAYSSVENIGIVFIGIGAGLLGIAWHIPVLMTLGFGGALLHILNHSFFKGLLFMGGGAVLHETGTGNMNRMGGLMKRMPGTAYGFLIGAAAASALPPLNGFVSEFLLYSAGIKGVMFQHVPTLALSAGLLISLALIGGLAAVCFTKCFGLVFLGEPRRQLDKPVHEVSFSMRLPMIVLAAMCLASGLAAPLLVRATVPGLNVLLGVEIGADAILAETAIEALVPITIIAASLIGLWLLIRGIRAALGRGRSCASKGVWDCGYAAPNARMQYTPSSYSRPVAALFAPFLREKRTAPSIREYFPVSASFSTETGDLARDRIFAPLLRGIARALTPFRRLQHGRVHIYVIYIAVTLVTLLIWTSGD